MRCNRATHTDKGIDILEVTGLELSVMYSVCSSESGQSAGNSTNYISRMANAVGLKSTLGFGVALHQDLVSDSPRTSSSAAERVSSEFCDPPDLSCGVSWRRS